MKIELNSINPDKVTVGKYYLCLTGRERKFLRYERGRWFDSHGFNYSDPNFVFDISPISPMGFLDFLEENNLNLIIKYKGPQKRYCVNIEGIYGIQTESVVSIGEAIELYKKRISGKTIQHESHLMKTQVPELI